MYSLYLVVTLFCGSRRSYIEEVEVKIDGWKKGRKIKDTDAESHVIAWAKDRGSVGY